MNSNPHELVAAAQPALALVGAAVCLVLLLRLLLAAVGALVAPKAQVKKLGSWAIVTGATDGIGLAVAHELARRGLNVLLVSRNSQLKGDDASLPENAGQGKLDVVARQLTQAYPSVKVEKLVVDFGSLTHDDKSAIRAAVSRLHKDGGVGVLVNNVGISYDFPMYYHELSEERVDALIEVNVRSTAWMTYLVLPFMVERKRGAVVNIGSGASLQTNPLLAEYAAAKSFVEQLSEGLDVEYRGRGIRVQCHTPYFIVSKMSKFRRPSLVVPSAEQYAKLLCNSIGVGGSVLSVFLPHRIMGWVASSLPKPVVEAFMLRHHLGIRARGMKKRAKA